jgi:Ni,Fe-hydrogenase III component G
MNANEVAQLIKRYADDVKIAGVRQVFATTDKERYIEALTALRDNDLKHLTTITGVDRGDSIDVIYHIHCGESLLNLKLSVPKTDLEIETVTDIFPGAILYERELAEMLGVQVKGHPDPRRLFLSDDWPTGKFPLRKEVKK